MIKETDILSTSIKDFFTPKMIKFSILPFVLTLIIIYIGFFIIAGIGLDQLTTMDIQTSQTTIQNGIPHTDSFSAKLEGSSIIQFLMSYAITSYIASFLVYALGSLVVVYASVFIAVIIIGFLTPYILREIQRRHYKDIEMVGYSNIFEGILLSLKWILVMLLLFFIMIPLYLIPIVNILAFNLPLYYFFHKMITYDISSNICTKEEALKIKFFNKNKLRIKTLILYLISLIPFAIFFTSVFYVIYLGHTYFAQTKKLRG